VRRPGSHFFFRFAPYDITALCKFSSLSRDWIYPSLFGLYLVQRRHFFSIPVADFVHMFVRASFSIAPAILLRFRHSWRLYFQIYKCAKPFHPFLVASGEAFFFIFFRVRASGGRDFQVKFKLVPGPFLALLSRTPDFCSPALAPWLPAILAPLYFFYAFSPPTHPLKTWST